jgi:hypothetical protein
VDENELTSPPPPPNLSSATIHPPQGFGSAFNADPDPAIFLIVDPESGSGSRIRIQGLMT